MRVRQHNHQPIRLRLWSRQAAKTTCPRCQTQYEGIGCLQCGWVADTSVAYFEAETLQEGKAIA